ncbi:MAG: hypothetical protein WC827_01050 [Candidatus Paceibacterota bacterium]|jgi:hypothetical protein
MKKKIVWLFFIIAFILIGVFYYKENKEDKITIAKKENQVEKISNLDDSKSIEIAKSYILKKPQLYLNREEFVNWESSKLGIDFVKVSPEWVVSQKLTSEYNAPNTYPSPYDYLNDKIIVSWFFIPGCEENINSTDQPNWFNKDGVRCLGGYDLRVIINSDGTVSLVELNAID